MIKYSDVLSCIDMLSTSVNYEFSKLWRKYLLYAESMEDAIRHPWCDMNSYDMSRYDMTQWRCDLVPHDATLT